MHGVSGDRITNEHGGLDNQDGASGFCLRTTKALSHYSVRILQ